MMRRVVKVGGSLLGKPDLPDAITRWYSRQPQAETLMIVGGGGLVEAMRQLDRVRHVDPADMHWMCVDLLETTYWLLAACFDCPRITTAEAIAHAEQHGFAADTPTLVSVSSFYSRQQDAVGIDIPCDWRTTSDTIAALLAHRVGAEELVLLKSCDVDPTASIEQLARSGIVDESFPLVAQLAPNVRVERL